MGNGMPTSMAVGEVERKAIEDLGLRRIDTSELKVERVVENGRFSFLKGGRPLAGRRDLKRIAELVIPPAWTDVRVAVDQDAHLQVVGRDSAGRLQDIYHSAWEDVRAASKAFRLIQLGQALPALRATIDSDLGSENANLSLATAARLVDLLRFRAGHETYAGEEGGRGVATLLKRHLRIDGETIRFCFRGKGGKRIEKSYTDGRLADVLAELRRLRGRRLFKVKGQDGYRPMTASDLNSYLAQASGKPVTAKDFRTLYGSATALDQLSQIGHPESRTAGRRTIAEVARTISAELANTPAVTRKSYIHPSIIEKFEACELAGTGNFRTRRGLSAAESNLMRFLESEAG
jgi:DNA topoisomerase-1